MNPGVLGEIMPLALLDSVSVATLLVPVLFLLGEGPLRYGNVFRYLLVVAAGYLLLGLLLIAGLSTFRTTAAEVAQSGPGDLAITGLAIGLVLFAAGYGLWQRLKPAGESRLLGWRDKVVGPEASWRGVLLIGVVAVLLESVMMFPYLIAVDRLDGSGNTWLGNAFSLALYCLLMVLPAAVLTIGRRFAGHLLQPLLVRINAWIQRTEREDTAWIIAIAGVLLFTTTDLFDALME
ncbi:GAP family protein [Kineosporia babensis]|uniref:GAP family protein n=1 Tax=Kineosporia babensis TaxID=499548 RepID=A0A9X1SVY2_9ACTN|nr:GAP family protein [Kineosporia babensis]MCD5314139.1 GAP family protein [Kineosporia babensis]